MEVIAPKVRTPNTDDPILGTIAANIRPDAEAVNVKLAGKLKPFGNCYWNVARACEESQGVMLLGWLVFEWPGLYYELMHHAVWKMPNGNLLDVTEKYSIDPVTRRSVFIADDSIPIDLERLPNITSRMHTLLDHPSITNYRNAYLARNQREQRQAQILWELGYRCDQQFAVAAGRKPEQARLSDEPRLMDELRSIAVKIKADGGKIGECIKDIIRFDSERPRGSKSD